MFIVGASSNNTIGGTAAGAANVIANSGKTGVAVGFGLTDRSTGNAILSDSIYGNAKLGIDLGNDGVRPNTRFTLQFFSNPTSDPSGHGQRQTLLDTITVTTDSNGNASFAATFSPAVAVGQVVTGTATDPIENTAEFAQDLTVVAGQAPAIAIGASVRPPVGTNVTLADTAQDWGIAALLPTDLDLHDLALGVTQARLRRPFAG